MSASPPPTQFGRISPPDEAWLAKQPPEPILDPELPIIDPHHHLWQRPDHRYLLDDFSPMFAPATTLSPRCSRNATPCTAPADQKRCGR